MNKRHFCSFYIWIILGVWASHGQNCQLNYSLIRAKESEYRRFLLKLESTEVRPEELVLQNDFDVIHFKSTIDLAKKVFKEELAKLRNEIQDIQPGRFGFEESEEGYPEMKTKCSTECGEGERLVSKVICEDANIPIANCSRPKLITEIQPCFSPFGCPPVSFGEWSEWSECSRSCVDATADAPVRIRVRTCTPPCSYGRIEERPCNVPVCPPTCPEYTATLDRDVSNDLKVAVILTLDPPERTIGTNPRQEVSIRNFYTNEVVDSFNVTYGKAIHRTNLEINSAYVPEIRVINEIHLRSSPPIPISILVHHCQGRVLHCDFFICNDETRILAEELCDNRVNCPDSSDERAEICTGTFSLGLITFTLFIFLYIIIGVGVFLYENKDEFYLKNPSPRTEDELQELRMKYKDLHDNSNTHEFLEEHKNDREVLLKVVQAVEYETHGHIRYEAYECLKNAHTFAGGNMIVMGSVSGRFKALIPYRIRRIGLALQYCFRSAAFYFDVYKDIALIFALHHISKEILHFRFGNGMRLDILALYILILIIASQLTVHIYSFVQRRNEPDKWMALFFPIHNAFDKNELFIDLQLIETFIERVPQLMVILCLWNESEKNSRLGLLLFFIFDGKLGLSAKFIFILSLITTYIGVLRSSIQIYDRKRYPLTPSGTGKILQYFLFSSLLIPKTLVASWIFRHYPYFYPISMVAEMFLIGSIYKLNLEITRITPCNLEIVCATVIVPSFYRKSKFCVIQNLFLFFLLWAAISLPLHYIFHGYLETDPFAIYSISDFAFASLSYYGVGFICYIIFGFFYYFYGHNWAHLIRTNRLQAFNISQAYKVNKTIE